MDKEEYVLVNKLFASLHVNVLRERMPQFTPLCFTIVLVKADSALYIANRKQGRLTQYLFWGPKRANVVFKAVKKAIFSYERCWCPNHKIGNTMQIHYMQYFQDLTSWPFWAHIESLQYTALNMQYGIFKCNRNYNLARIHFKIRIHSIPTLLIIMNEGKNTKPHSSRLFLG